MQTCVVQTNVTVFLDKLYYYHGLLMKCKKEVEGDPYLCKMVEEYGAKWEKIYERWNTTKQTYTLDYNVADFLPSGSKDRCSIKFPDGFERYYFCEIEIWDGTAIIGWSMDMNGIVPCRVWSTAGQYHYYYKSYEATIWAEKPWLVWIYQWVPNSHFVVWRSHNGDLPVDPPVPIREYWEEKGD